MLRSIVILATIALGFGLMLTNAPQALDQGDWRRYVERFIAADGRVIDTGNGGVSHSEGQGYGMLLAVAFADRATFERLWDWTRRNLQIRDDRLFAWRYDPGAEPQVGDLNSAADGDILVAWALARAADRFAEPAYAHEAEAIAKDVLRLLVHRDGGRTMLLPAPEGFAHDDAITVNLSYWLWPAFADFERLVPSERWADLARTGLDLVADARFGNYRLPPDWLELNGTPAPSPMFAPVYGYNAIRIPLHLVWGGHHEAWRLAPFVDLEKTFHGLPPATVDLASGDLDPVALSAGGRAILELARRASGGEASPWPTLDEAPDYFSASLLLLARLAHSERLEG